MQAGTDAQPPGYFGETRQPIYSAALVLPFLLAYELGLVYLHSERINGGDAILLNLGGKIMQFLGLRAGFASVVVLVVFFITAQVYRKGNWRVRPALLAAAFLESFLYAVLLFAILVYFAPYLPRARRADSTPPEAQRGHTACVARDQTYAAAPGGSTRLDECTCRPPALDACAPRDGGAAPYPMGEPSERPGLQAFVLFCGAGVYEELVFRVILLGVLMLVFTKLFHMEHAYAAVWAVLLGAGIFSAFHHIGGERFSLSAFLQRIFAGLYFAAIYFNRSFGIAAASHALYDILVGVNQYV
ncbi:MAG: CPBP family intramembrane glutamic endopeptidase [Planctomycetota bacterium]